MLKGGRIVVSTVGLVLEGGGLRGTYTSGVLDAFMEYEIKFPYIIGVSAGICNAVSYLSQQKGRSAQINMNHCNDKNYYGLGNFFKTGSIFSEKMLFDLIPHELYPFDYDTYQKECQHTKLIAGTTDCVSGKPVYYELNDLRNQYDIVKATSWLPFLSQMVEYDGKKLLDGGASDSIPVKKSIADGNEKNVIVLTQPEGYRKKSSKQDKLAHIVYRKYPNLIDNLVNRYQTYNDTLDEIKKLESEGKAFVIKPSRPLGLGRLEKDPEKIRFAYEMGYEDAVNGMEKLKQFLQVETDKKIEAGSFR